MDEVTCRNPGLAKVTNLRSSNRVSCSYPQQFISISQSDTLNHSLRGHNLLVSTYHYYSVEEQPQSAGCDEAYLHGHIQK